MPVVRHTTSRIVGTASMRLNISLKVVSRRDPPISYRQWLGRAGMTPQTRRNPQMASQVAVGEGDRQIRLFDLLV
jgi:hypothetical protein